MIARWAFAFVPWLALAFVPRPPAPTSVLIVSDLRGYLSPCGCVKPMQGGIRRLAGAVEAVRASERALLFVNGDLSGPLGRQSELKLETLAESFRAMRVSGIGLAATDAQKGAGVVAAMQTLSGGKLLASNLSESNALGLLRGREVGPFWVISLSRRAEVAATALDQPLGQWQNALMEARGKPVIVLFDGPLDAASVLANAHPQIRLIAYSGSSQASQEPTRAGNAWLVTGGDQGKSLLRLRWVNGGFQDLEAISLGPEAPETENVQRLYQSYLRRVDEENLLEQMPRAEGDPYAGTQLCGSCHSKDYTIWKETQHAAALKTLEDDGHDRDPDCVSCHVVGLDKIPGFRDRKTTPDLADVGCESCHGPGKAHSLRPMEIKMPKIGRESCMSCHVPAHSPGFEYDTYWKRIAHGQEKPTE